LPDGDDFANFRIVVDDAVRANTTDRWQAYMTAQLDAFLQPLNELTGLLPEPVIVNYARCGEANAFYSRLTRQVTICDEIIDDLLVYWQTLDFAVLAAGFVLYHEIGHALDDIRQIPISGNTESAADSIGVVLSVTTNRAFAAVFGGDYLSSAPPSYGDEHTNGQDRAGDIICWAIGSDSSLAFNSTLAPFTNQFIQANRDCGLEYREQQQSIFQLVPELANIQPSAVWIPREVFPDDPEPPKSSNPTPVGPGGGGGDGNLLSLLQNETDPTVGNGRTLWFCTASNSAFPIAYLFVGDRGLNFYFNGDENPPVFSFNVTNVGESSIELTYPEDAGVIVETISSLTFSGTNSFTGISDIEGNLDCTLVLVDAADARSGGSIFKHALY